MLAFSLPDGRFHDILDDEASFIDGASAMMASASVYRGIKDGFLPETYRAFPDRVSETMESCIDPYGIIHGVAGCPDFLEEGTSAESMAAYLMMHAWREKAGMR